MPNCIASVHRTTAFSTVCHCTTVCHHCMSSLHVTPPVASLHLTTAVHHCNVSQHLTTAVHHCIITLFYHCELHRITLHSCISTLNTPHFHCIGLCIGSPIHQCTCLPHIITEYRCWIPLHCTTLHNTSVSRQIITSNCRDAGSHDCTASLCPTAAFSLYLNVTLAIAHPCCMSSLHIIRSSQRRIHQCTCLPHIITG